MKNAFHRWAFGILTLIGVPGLVASVESSRLVEAPPARYVMGLSPFLEKGVKDEVFRQIAGFVLEGMPIGSSLGLYDAYRLRTIATITIPEAKAFRSGRTRANQFKGELNQLKRFLVDEPAEVPGRGTNLTEAVRFPQFLDFVTDNTGTSNLPLVILVLGSPLYADAKEPTYSMVDGYFPSDGHLLAGRERSVFGVREQATVLTNSVVHLGYFGDPWVTDIHREKVLRFWNLFVAQRGSQLGAFSADLPTVFEAVKRGIPPPDPGASRFKLDPSQTKIEMIRISRDLGVADWITRETLPHHSQPPPTTRSGPMKIGIRWQGDIDLDLYATPRRGTETLFFEHPRSPEGYYFKDHRSSPLREYEFIEFEAPVDVRDVDARINFYAGKVAIGPTGEVRIEFNGRIYSGPFTLAALRGNEGRAGSSQTAFWARIDVPAILGLTDGNREAHPPGSR